MTSPVIPPPPSPRGPQAREAEGCAVLVAEVLAPPPPRPPRVRAPQGRVGPAAAAPTAARGPMGPGRRGPAAAVPAGRQMPGPGRRAPRAGGPAGAPTAIPAAAPGAPVRKLVPVKATKAPPHEDNGLPYTEVEKRDKLQKFADVYGTINWVKEKDWNGKIIERATFRDDKWGNVKVPVALVMDGPYLTMLKPYFRFYPNTGFRKGARKVKVAGSAARGKQIRAQEDKVLKEKEKAAPAAGPAAGPAGGGPGGPGGPGAGGPGRGPGGGPGRGPGGGGMRGLGGG